jgi:hypothetical protein
MSRAILVRLSDLTTWEIELDVITDKEVYYNRFKLLRTCQAKVCSADRWYDDPGCFLLDECAVIVADD